MPHFEIYFHGLICFYGDEDRFGQRGHKTEALIVEDNDHTRMVKTYNSEKKHFHSIKTSLTPGTVDASDQAFQNFIPHMSDVWVTRTSVAVKPAKAIRLALPDRAVAKVAQLYPYKGIYELDGMRIEHPVCRISVLTIDADALTITADGYDVVVPPDQPWVAILNYSADQGEGVAENHFHRYARITNGSLEDIAEVTNSPSPATDLPGGEWVQKVKDFLGQLQDPTVGQTQCSNTNWP